MDEATRNRIQQLIDSKKVFLFMKGTPQFPMCGFSAQIAGILKQTGADFGAFNVLEDESVRQGIKEFANWPTIPQLYIDGKFVGGCDIVTDMFQRGDLQKALDAS